jgi:nitrite reductase/ring-hydroxylating ferredoxin subunit
VIAVSLGLAALLAWVATGAVRDARWQRIASLEELRGAVVMRDSETHSVVIAREGRVLAFSDRSPHEVGGVESFTYCPSSGQFEGPHGEKWDWQGRYVGGPAPRGLDRIGVKVENGEVFVDPDDLTQGASRASEALGADGPFCDKV